MAIYDGINKVAGGLTPMITLTKAQYDVLTPAEKLGNIYMTTDEVESNAVATANTNGLMSAWDKGLVNKYVSATAESNGDFYITLQGVLATNDVVGISFPTATNGASNARLSIDGGTTYKNIKLSTIRIASEVASRKLSFVYDGTDFVPLETEYFHMSWTPQLTGSVSNPTITWIVREGFYIRNGNVVTANIVLSGTVGAGGSGNLLLSIPLVGFSYVGTGSNHTKIAYTDAPVAGLIATAIAPNSNLLTASLYSGTGSNIAIPASTQGNFTWITTFTYFTK